MLSWFEGDFGGQKLRDKPDYRAANGRACWAVWTVSSYSRKLRN